MLNMNDLVSQFDAIARKRTRSPAHPRVPPQDTRGTRPQMDDYGLVYPRLPGSLEITQARRQIPARECLRLPAGIYGSVAGSRARGRDVARGLNCIRILIV